MKFNFNPAEALDGESPERMEAFARNILHARDSGPWPLPDTERAVVVLAEMVVTLARYAQSQRELCSALREAAEALPLLICYLEQSKPKKIPRA